MAPLVVDDRGQRLVGVSRGVDVPKDEGAEGVWLFLGHGLAIL